MNGIDVSHYQGIIDWTKVKNNGIGFAMCKASQGSKLSDSSSEPFEDAKFGEYIKGAAGKGIFCGAYHFLTGTDSGKVKEETDFFIKTVKKYAGLITFPCACDLEDQRYKKFTKSENSSLVKLFAERVRAAGLVPMLYTNLDFSRNYLDMNALAGIDIWFARYYAVRSPEPKPDISGITMFQWNESGKVDGILGMVDLDVCYCDYGKDAAKAAALAAVKITVGDTVAFKESAKTYWPSGPAIPDNVRKKTYKVIQTESRGAEVVKGGAKCVLLGGINTWAAEEALKRA